MDEATVQILLKAKQEGMDAIKDMTANLKDLRTALLETRAAGSLAELGKEFQMVGDGIQKLATSALNAIPFVGNLGTAIAGIPAVGPIFVVVVLAMAAALAVLTGSVIATMAVIGAAVVTVLTAATIGFGALGLAVASTLGPFALLYVALNGLLGTVPPVEKALQALIQAQTALGIPTSAAQQAQLHAFALKNLKDAQDQYTAAVEHAKSPMGQFDDAVAAMKSRLQEQAIPIVNLFEGAFLKVLPTVEKLASGIISWLGDRVPGVLKGLEPAVNLLSLAFSMVGNVVGPFIDQLSTRLPAMGRIATDVFINWMLPALQGLLDNFIKFVDWFIKNWPLLEPIIRQVMDQAGRAIQWFGQQAAQLVQWFITNWPQIAKQAQELMPVINALTFIVQMLFFAFVELMRLEDKLVGFLGNVGRAFSGLGGIASGVAGALDSVLTKIGLIQSSGGGNLGGGGGGGGFASGGTVPGPVGSPQFILAHGGERVMPVGGQGTDMQDTNAILVSILMEIRSQRRSGLSTVAYASRA